ncbi:hypothetical protein PHYBOEH_000095 [Phytophthora boehmeriae]|uniref:Uncharacterized protein n=1 Tax=Phytophthora boehmeriae TaxID=109152 RepID=A0A8T1X880_9STRA|nr:hypothetical protein PHYBOEH_000095 [Phytophthora boehmeriae]
MEPSFVVNPYVQTVGPHSRYIQEMLDREEASYVSERKNRKPVRLPYASKKLNNPVQPLPTLYKYPGSNQARSQPLILKKSTNESVTNEVPGQHTILSAALIPSQSVKRKVALGSGVTTRSTEVLPKLGGAQKQVQFTSTANDQKKEPEDDITTSVAPRRTARKQLQQYLYDFHSRQVFSLASDEEDIGNKNQSTLLDIPNNGSNSDNNMDDRSLLREDSVATINNLHDLQNDHQEECILSDLGFSSQGDYDTIFEADWKSSEVEKSVRDAVDRKRIHGILKKAYRMLLWFFRYYAGNAAYAAASERRMSSGAVVALGEGLFEIPSRTVLLENLNVEYVDDDIIDSPLKREHLVDFLLDVARMMCLHSSNPTRMRMVISEGIAMSAAVKTIVHDHFGAFAQIQDVNHFRSLFLSKVTAHENLQRIIERHKTKLANFFENQTSSGAAIRGGSLHDRLKGQHHSRPNGIACTPFLAILRAVNLISNGAATTSTDDDGEENTGPMGVDEVRAVRIFLSCLPMGAVRDFKRVDAGTTFTSSSNSEPRELNLHQFIEALLRVAFTWKELQVCNGRFDVCPNQMASDWCRCTADSNRYNFKVYDDAAEEIFTRIHAYHLKRAQRTHLKTTTMKTTAFSLRKHQE